MEAGDIARKYLELLRDIEDDDTMVELDKLRTLPVPDADKWHREAVADYLTAKLEGTW